MFRVTLFPLLILLLFAGELWAQDSPTSKSKDKPVTSMHCRGQFDLENDMLVNDSSDRFYTNGIYYKEDCLDDKTKKLEGWDVGNVIYTPSDFTFERGNPDVPTDRPYAGVFHIGYYEVNPPSKQDYQLGWEMQMGCMGVCSGAGTLQEGWHEILRNAKGADKPYDPVGWDSQYPNYYWLNASLWLADQGAQGTPWYYEAKANLGMMDTSIEGHIGIGTAHRDRRFTPVAAYPVIASLELGSKNSLHDTTLEGPADEQDESKTNSYGLLEKKDFNQIRSYAKFQVSYEGDDYALAYSYTVQTPLLVKPDGVGSTQERESTKNMYQNHRYGAITFIHYFN